MQSQAVGGPSGFENAPVSKCLVIGIGAGSFLLSTVANTWVHRLSLPVAVPLLLPNWQLWRLVTQHLFFSSTSEALFGLFLLYHFRVFERRMGSSKYAMFAVLVSVFATLIQLVFFSVLRHTNRASGPYALIFASFYLYLRSIPATQRVRLFSFWLSDKSFTYLAGAQLILMNFPSALLFALAGITSGAIYQSDLINVRTVQFPQAITNWCSQHLLPLLEPRQAPSHSPTSSSSSSSASSVHPVTPRATAAAASAAAASFAPPLVAPILPPTMSPPTLPRATAMLNQESIDQLVAMGFSAEDSRDALIASGGDASVATDLLLSASQ